MQDREWLEKISMAYRVYEKQIGADLSVKKFISWMYEQYGIVETKDP